MKHTTRLFILVVLLLASTAVAALSQIGVEDFFADFESGSLGNIYPAGNNRFHIELKLDDLNQDTYGWFYFGVVGDAGDTIEICFTNPSEWQGADDVPIYSLDNVAWSRVDSTWMFDWLLCFSQVLQSDTTWFAQAFPYTATEVYSYLDSNAAFQDVRIDTIGYSAHGRPIKMVTVQSNREPIVPRKQAFLISRQHPMESSPTFVIRGLLEAVLDSTALGIRFRDLIELRIVPIVNVDGVVEGLSRHNVNGINLNRDWQSDIASEQPEVEAVHGLLDSLMLSGSGPDLFLDLHSSPTHCDFGYAIAYSYTYPAFFYNQETFAFAMETFDQWSDRSNWIPIDSSYAPGTSQVTLYDLYELDAITHENPWTMRHDGSFINIESLYEQGSAFAEALSRYLCPITLVDSEGHRLPEVRVGSSVNVLLKDYDQREQEIVGITVRCIVSQDYEDILLESIDTIGTFVSISPIPTNNLTPSSNDGALSCGSPDEVIVCEYTEPNMPERSYSDFFRALLCGDSDGSGGVDIDDVVYLLQYIFSGGHAPDPLESSDVDCSGGVDIDDVVYLIAYIFAGGHAPCDPDGDGTPIC